MVCKAIHSESHLEWWCVKPSFQSSVWDWWCVKIFQSPVRVRSQSFCVVAVIFMKNLTANLKHFEGSSSTAKLRLNGARPILDFKRLTLKAAQIKELGCKSRDSLSSATVSGRGRVPVPPFLVLHKHPNTFPDPQKTPALFCSRDACLYFIIYHVMLLCLDILSMTFA